MTQIKVTYKEDNSIIASHRFVYENVCAAIFLIVT